MALIRKLAPSILNADFASLGSQIAEIEKGGADWVHLDIMDGNFVPNISIGPVVVEAISKFCKLPLDCHLMIVNPEKYVGDFAKAGADSITVHQESTLHLDSLVKTVKSLTKKDGFRMRVGVSLNPATPIESLEHVLSELDLVLIMSVNPGFGGQKFIPYALDKARKLRARAEALGLSLDIQMDGGIGPKNVQEVMAAGVNVVVAGTAIFGSADISGACRSLKTLMG